MWRYLLYAAWDVFKCLEYKGSLPEQRVVHFQHLRCPSDDIEIEIMHAKTVVSFHFVEKIPPADRRTPPRYDISSLGKRDRGKNEGIRCVGEHPARGVAEFSRALDMPK